MNGTTPAGPAPMPDNDDKGQPVIPRSGLPQSQGSPPPASEPSKPPPPPKAQSPLPPPPPPPPPAGGSVVPPPPGQEVDIRTLVSDAKSLKSSGGLGAEPETFAPTDLAGDATFMPQVDVSAKASKSKKRIIFISLGILVMLGVAAGAVYFFVLPLFSPQEPEVIVDETPVPPPPPQPLEPSFVHTSFLVGSDASENVLLDSLELNQILAVQAGGSFPSGSIKEINFAIGGNPVSSQDFLGLLLPGLDGELFDQDFTNFVYYDDDGAWPGYIFLLGNQANKGAATVAVASNIENVSNITPFYLTSPGSADVGGFKNGSVDSANTRYVPFELDGASFNYGWSGDYLILSTSFSGFQKVLGLLGS